jgi:hypothetical protein
MTAACLAPGHAVWNPGRQRTSLTAGLSSKYMHSAAVSRRLKGVRSWRPHLRRQRLVRESRFLCLQMSTFALVVFEYKYLETVYVLKWETRTMSM